MKKFHVFFKSELLSIVKIISLNFWENFTQCVRKFHLVFKKISPNFQENLMQFFGKLHTIFKWILHNFYESFPQFLSEFHVFFGSKICKIFQYRFQIFWQNFIDILKNIFLFIISGNFEKNLTHFGFSLTKTVLIFAKYWKNTRNLG